MTDDRAYALLHNAGLLGRYRIERTCCGHDDGETFAPSKAEAENEKRSYERPVEGHTRKATVMIL